jgi:PIN domain nuclease of toxin-antitoxin system
MKFLLDTNIIIWNAEGRTPLSLEPYIYNPDNTLFFSAASIWEIAIKNCKNRSDFYVDPHILLDGLLENGYRQLPVDSRHASYIGKLPMLHKDPFDRILISQSIIEGITLITADKLLIKYPAPVILI